MCILYGTTHVEQTREISLGYGLGYAGVRVCVGVQISNPYPNPGKTRQFTLGFSIPVTIPRHGCFY